MLSWGTCCATSPALVKVAVTVWLASELASHLAIRLAGQLAREEPHGVELSIVVSGLPSSGATTAEGGTANEQREVEAPTEQREASSFRCVEARRLSAKPGGPLLAASALERVFVTRWVTLGSTYSNIAE